MTTPSGGKQQPAYQLYPASTATTPPPKAVPGQFPQLQKRYRTRQTRWRFWCFCGLCSLCTVLLLIVAGTAAALLFWLSHVKVSVQGLGAQNLSQGAPIYMIAPDTMGMNFTVNVQVVNNNDQGLSLDEVAGTGYFRASDSDMRLIATGDLKNVNVPAKSTTTLAFPVTAVYGTATDPGNVALKALVTKCGLVNPAQSGTLPVEFQVRIRGKVVGLTLSGNFTVPTNLSCPLPPGSSSNPLIQQVVQGLQANGTS